ncbi:MAG TPA: SRPBCC domain-containing protein [Rhizomicrobium sp.]|nr:SRPBCC domain-containing protein [Rhizomicrobium sp.]
MSSILVSVRVRAGPRAAFDVFTRDIALWWQPSPLFRFTPRDGGVLSFEPREGGRFIETLPSGTVFEIGKIRVWEPGRCLVFGWRQATFAKDQNTEVEVSFEALGAETRVTVEHRGWDSVPQTHVARHTMSNVVFLRRHGEWWRVLLEAMAARTP